MIATANTVNNCLLVYASGSGNTQEVADIISSELLRLQVKHDKCKVGRDDTPPLSHYDFIIMGSYSVKMDGRVPNEMKAFIESTDFYQPKRIAIFGTGDTQWANFCGAATRLAIYYGSPYPVLRIEQSPRNGQEPIIIKWTKEVIFHDRANTI